jgi:hypothetical protein
MNERNKSDPSIVAAREHKRSRPLKIGTRDLGSCDDLGAKLLMYVPNQVLDEE